MRPVRMLFMVGGLFFAMLIFTAALLAIARMDLVVSGAGVLEPLYWRYITPEVKGIVKEVLKGPGDQVTEGEVIARLDAADAEKRREQAAIMFAEAEKEEAVLVEQCVLMKERKRVATLELADFPLEKEKAQGKYDAATATRRKTEAGVANAERSVAAGRLRYEEARQEHTDQKKLAAAGLVSERIVERARIAMDLQKIAMENSVSDLEAARQGLEAAKAAETIARAEMEGLSETTLKSVLDTADFDMKRTMLLFEQATAKKQRLAAERDRLAHQVDTYTIRAPMTGVLQKLYLFEGEMSGTGPDGTASGIAGLVSADEHYTFVMQVPHLEVTKVRPGQEVEVRVDAYPYRTYGTFRGVVSSVLRSTTEGQFSIKVRLDKSIYPIRAGMNGYARIVVGEVNVLSYLFGFAEDEEIKALRKKADETGSATVPFEKTPAEKSGQ